MLHIVTPLFRFELLKKVYLTIPKHPDITWHIAQSAHREELIGDFLDLDPRIRLYEIDCLDNDLVSKRNWVFNKIHDGYFCLLDDDTIFLNELYNVYKEISSENFDGMVIGNQQTLVGPKMLKASYPTDNAETTLIDSGMVISHHRVLKSVKWALSHTFRDRDFWCRCSRYFGRDSIRLVNKTISVYNYFGPKIKVRKKILFFKLTFDIYNPLIATCYEKLANGINLIKNVGRDFNKTRHGWISKR